MSAMSFLNELKCMLTFLAIQAPLPPDFCFLIRPSSGRDRFAARYLGAVFSLSSCFGDLVHLEA